jgi:class 3 adenylate cyclase/pimeloyl-ACP methyl ester carboxylesterase
MSEIPETRYARTPGGDRVAFQVIGTGPLDVLVNRSPWFPIDLMWDEPRLVFFLNRLSAFCRHIWFDARGTGASDAVGRSEGRLIDAVLEDMLAVVDAAGCERVALVDMAGGPSGVLFAATHPERTAALVLFNSAARLRAGDDYPIGLSEEEIADRIAHWGELGIPDVGWVAPSLTDDAAFRRWYERSARVACPPKDWLWRLRSFLEVDARDILASVRVPTLVLSRRDNEAAAASRYVADHIPGAQGIELAGADLVPFVGDAGAVVDAIETFLTGQRTPPPPERILATVLFTDLVDSTGHAAAMGDRRWREVLATHDTLVRRELDRYRGREIKTTGDGVLAIFDGPGRAIRCAFAIRDAIQALGVQVRAGLHTGEIELRGDDIAGIAVHVGQRVASHAGPSEVLVSRTVADLIAGSDLELVDRGEHELKGLPGTWHLFRVAG